MRVRATPATLCPRSLDARPRRRKETVLQRLFSTFPGHKLLFSKNKYIIENMANLHKLPARGAYVIALPLKIEKGGEAPARVVGLVRR